MRQFSGSLQKMHTTLLGELLQVGKENESQQTVKSNIEYALVIDNQPIALNSAIGQNIELNFQGSIHCIHCDRKTNKSFSQGYCYPCFKALARCDICIVSPEKCHYHLGTCREPSWADEFCMQEHVVYLANSSGLKVGITRGTQIPTRWIDQGAVQALPIYRVQTRLQAGLVETVFKAHVADKTNWRAMLKGSPELLDLTEQTERLKKLAANDIKSLHNEYGLQAIQSCETMSHIDIFYPVLEYPLKVTSLNFDKTPHITGRLLGIKGQYLILDSGVLNLRKFGGYKISVTLP